MRLKYLPLLIASFAVVAADEPNLVTNDFYNVAISISDEGQLVQKATQQLPVNSKSAFGITETQSYVKDITKTYKWYHTLFGIEPDPILNYGEYKTGFEGFVTVNKVSEQEVSVEVLSSFSELIKLEKSGIVEFPSLSTKNFGNKAIVNLEQNNGCLQINTDVDICITKA
ncbi:hypothetical protein [Vibrio crassostreae]|uniref:hypothetical protein n=1 Tax=Vibrio crassostreae TaxID=246167 RepID=UPI001B30947F|nr:hypothetical protein [Vibrio crassostreae]